MSLLLLFRCLLVFLRRSQAKIDIFLITVARGGRSLRSGHCRPASRIELIARFNIVRRNVALFPLCTARRGRRVVCLLVCVCVCVCLCVFGGALTIHRHGKLRDNRIPMIRILSGPKAIAFLRAGMIGIRDHSRSNVCDFVQWLRLQGCANRQVWDNDELRNPLHRRHVL